MQGQAFQSDNGFFNVSAPAWQIQAATLGNIVEECPGVQAIELNQLPQGNYTMLLNGTCSMISALLNGSFSNADQCLMDRLNAATSGPCTQAEAGGSLLQLFGYTVAALLGIFLALNCLAGLCSNPQERSFSPTRAYPYGEAEPLVDQNNGVAVTVGAGAGAYVTYQNADAGPDLD